MLTLEAWVDIKSMHRQGRSIRSIAKELGVSRNTVRRYLRGTQPPSYERRAKRPSLLDPFKDYLRKRLEEKPEIHATVLLRELRERTPSPNWSGHLGEVMLNLFEEEENGGISQGRRWAPAVHDRLQEGADRPRPPGRDCAFGACA